MKRLLLLLLCSVASATNELDQPFSSNFANLVHAPCVTLFHRNGSMGCGTQERSLQRGQLRYFDGSLPQTEDPYVAVIEDYMLTAETFQTLSVAQGGLLQGILVLNATTSSDTSRNSYVGENSYRSPDSQNPQGYGTPSEGLQYGYYQYAWNAKGEDLFAYDLFGIAMAYVMDSDMCEILRKDSSSDSSDDAIVAEFNYYMGAQGVNSLQCLQWKDAATDNWAPKCLPLGGTSVWATAGSPPQPKNNNIQKRPIVMVGAGMDSTSLFHDVAPGANTAASNILTLLMVAKLIGGIDDETLDALPNRILLGMFQGESFGFVGSRSFLRDVAYPGFQCAQSVVRSVTKLGEQSEYACLNPMRPSLGFSNLGSKIAGMISVDQVGHETGDGLLYVHADKNNDTYGSFLAQIMMNSGTNSVSVVATSVSNSGNGYPYPPSPLTSLLQLSEGAVGGAVLTGYDYAFTNKVPYHSHMDSASVYQVDLKSIAAAATIIARTAVAAAYDDGSYDYETAAAYAKNLIPSISYKNEVLVELADCVYYNGQCDLFQKYSQVETANERSRTGLNLGNPSPHGTPPNYYVGVYNYMYGQPFVQVGDNIYGAYKGDSFGNRNSDAVSMVPTQLESSILGLMNDYLGRGTMGSSSPVSCSKLSDCANANYCSSYGEYATCTGGGVCVCRRANFHVALDEALKPAVNMPTGYFTVRDDDEEISAMYTEPYWSNSVGVKVFRDVGSLPGFFALVAGIAAAGISLFSAFVLRVGLKKEKLY
jgi:nicastrin